MRRVPLAENCVEALSQPIESREREPLVGGYRRARIRERSLARPDRAAGERCLAPGRSLGMRHTVLTPLDEPTTFYEDKKKNWTAHA